MYTKGFEFKVDRIGDKGEIEGYASVFGNVDLGGDIVVAGAFNKTISDGNISCPILWGHSMQELIGVNKEMREDDRGLYVKGEINLDVSRGREVHSLAKQGAVKGLSIGYQAVKWEHEKTKAGDYIRHLKEVKLYEYSLTPVPMNPDAQITRVKNWDVFLEELKVGRTISRATRERLERIYTEISSLLEADAEEADTEQDEPRKALVEQLESIKGDLPKWD